MLKLKKKIAADPAAERLRRLQSANTRFNQRKQGAPPPVANEAPKAEAPPPGAQAAFADRFIRAPETKKARSVLGQAEPRLEKISKEQARNLARLKADTYSPVKDEQAEAGLAQDASRFSVSSPSPAPAEVRQPKPFPATDERFQVEVAPLQAVAIDGEQVFVFRRIGINGQIYRQGFIVLLQPFLDHLFAAHYAAQPISRYTRLTLRAAGAASTRDGTHGDAAEGMVLAERDFPAPFGFLSAEMQAVSLPPSPARQTLTVALAILGIVMAAGLATIYRSARTVLDLSERRSRFVSAVTHELKTPLTNIRMYVEMLDQGIAATPEREQEYLGILASESARLSGLINNVLELSRLEKRTRRFDFSHGDLSDVLSDVQTLMAEPLARDGFVLTTRADGVPVFAYDRQVLVQVLINLMENSIKFGRHASEKRIVITAEAVGDRVDLSVSDTGPGIPRRALKHVFDDFYRGDDEGVRSTGGTGIGLALVKKFVLAMGGAGLGEKQRRPRLHHRPQPADAAGNGRPAVDDRGIGLKWLMRRRSGSFHGCLPSNPGTGFQADRRSGSIPEHRKSPGSRTRKSRIPPGGNRWPAGIEKRCKSGFCGFSGRIPGAGHGRGRGKRDPAIGNLPVRRTAARVPGANGRMPGDPDRRARNTLGCSRPPPAGCRFVPARWPHTGKSSSQKPQKNH